jgi:hypothetical protein
MNEVVRFSAGLLALAVAVAPATAPAAELDLGYLEAAYVRGLGGGPADGGPDAVGIAGALRLPMGRSWFVAGSSQRLEPYIDDFGARHDEEYRYTAGLGVRQETRGQELFGQVTYVKYENWRNDGDPPRVEGGLLSFGARNMLSEHVELGLEGGMGYVEGSGAHQLLMTGRGSLAYEFAPRVWLYAAGSLALLDYSMAYAGLRFSFPGPRRARLPPAVKPVERGAPTGLAAGTTLVAQRALQLQARPAFGAPETIVVPAGGALSLVEAIENSFGRWWRVRAGEQEGWIREGHLR